MSVEHFGSHRSNPGVSKMVPKPMGLCRKLTFVDADDENMNHSYEEGLNSSGVSSEGISDFHDPGVVTSSPIDKEKERLLLLSPEKQRFPCGYQSYRNPPMSPPYKRVKALRLSEEPNTPKTLFGRCVDKPELVKNSSKKLTLGETEVSIDAANDWDVQHDRQLSVTVEVEMHKKKVDAPVLPVFPRQRSLRHRIPAFLHPPSESEALPSPPANQFTPRGIDNPKKRTRSSNSISKKGIDTSVLDECDIESDDEQPSKRIALTNSNISRYHQEFHEISKIGSGQFGTVYMCRNRLDGCDYAIKKSLRPIGGSLDEKLAIREVQAHAILGKHPHVVRYYSAWSENSHMIIQNEYCNGGSLAEEAEERRKCGKKFSELELKDIMTQVAEGLRYIHSMHLAHLDIKPGNIFISREPRYDSADDGFVDDEAERDDVTYKIGDLGHVTSVDNPQVEEGDCRYMPFEILQEDFTHLPKSDVYALGLTIYELAGAYSLPKNGPVWQEIRQKGQLTKLEGMSDDLHELILRMIRPDPSKRPTAIELLQSSVLTNFSKNKFENLQRALRAERMKSQSLEKQLLQAVGQRGQEQSSPSRPTPKRSQRLVGKNMAKSRSSFC